jgi:hypothetical protein
VDVVEPHEAEDVARTANRLEQIQGVGIGMLGGFEEIEVEVLEPFVLRGDAGQIELTGFLPGWIIKALGHPVAVGWVGDLFADLG